MELCERKLNERSCHMTCRPLTAKKILWWNIFSDFYQVFSINFICLSIRISKLYQMHMKEMQIWIFFLEFDIFEMDGNIFFSIMFLFWTIIENDLACCSVKIYNSAWWQACRKLVLKSAFLTYPWHDDDVNILNFRRSIKKKVDYNSPSLLH